MLIAPLFVPSTMEKRFGKALDSNADSVILDLEDAVAHDQKAHARDILAQALSKGPLTERSKPLGLRINPISSEAYQEDLKVLNSGIRLDFVVLPMVETGEHIETFCSDYRGDAPVVVQIETPRGVLNALGIAEKDSVVQLAFGSADYANAMMVDATDSTALLFARSHIATASVAAGIAPALDAPHFALDDEAGLKDECKAGKRLGFGGKLCIHPKQAAVVLESYLPPQEEIDNALLIKKEFEAALEKGNSSVRLSNGMFADYPVYDRAITLLERAGDEGN